MSKASWLVVWTCLVLLGGCANVSERSVPLASSDPLQSTLAKADELADSMRFADVVSTLDPYAELGDAEVDYRLAHAQLQLAIEGRQPEQVDSERIAIALRHAERAAGKGSGEALNLLYLIHANGWGVPQDFKLALGYLQAAADAGDDGARLNLAVSLYEGNELVDRDHDRACAMLFALGQREALVGVVSYYLGLISMRGECGLEADRAGGMALLRLSAESGHRQAQASLARGLEFGWAGEPDASAALPWYEMAAENGEPYSQWRVGMAYLRGEGRRADSRKAVEYFSNSAASDDEHGLTSLAVMYATGDGVEQDYGEALRLYTRAADLGGSHAHRALASMYARGEGVAVDLVQARLRYLQSVALGSEEMPALRTEIESAMSPAQLASSDQRYAQWREER